MTQIKLRRDTAANFTSKNPVLGVGEPAYETDTKKLKIGDGTTAYTQLEYFSAGGGGGSTNISATLPLKIVDGVISLGVDGQTIQIVDGKLHANLDELGNEVNSLTGEVTDLSGRVTAAEADIMEKEDKLTPVAPITINKYAKSNLHGFSFTADGTGVYATSGQSLGYSDFPSQTPGNRVFEHNTAISSADESWACYIDVPISLGQVVKFPVPDASIYYYPMCILGKTDATGHFTVITHGYALGYNRCNPTDDALVFDGINVYTKNRLDYSSTSSHTDAVNNQDPYTGFVQLFEDEAGTFSIQIHKCSGASNNIPYYTTHKYVISDTSAINRFKEINTVRIVPFYGGTKSGTTADSAISTNSIGLYNCSTDLFSLNNDMSQFNTGNLFDISGETAHNYLELNLGSGLSVVDGKLTASSTAPTNMVTTDTTQTISGTKTFKGPIKVANSGYTRTLADVNTNGGVPYLYLGESTSRMYIRASNPISRMSGGGIEYPIIDTGNLGSYVDGTTITYADGKLKATYTELNNPYSLFDSKYSDHELNNLSWLKSEGQWNAKAVYPDAYDKILENVNNCAKGFLGQTMYMWGSASGGYMTTSLTPVVGSAVYEYGQKRFVGYVTWVDLTIPAISLRDDIAGISYTNIGRYSPSDESSYAYITDYDFVLNTTDETFRLPLLDGSENILSNERINYDLPTASGQTYTAQYNGSVQFNATTTGANQYIRLYNQTSGQIAEQRPPANNVGSVSYIAVKKGDVFQITGDAISTVKALYLIKAKGNGSLYFYVGETVQNANLIDAGRIGEQLATKTDMLQASSAGMPSNKYIDLTLGAKGSTYTAPANGWFWLLGNWTNADGYVQLKSVQKFYCVQTPNNTISGYHGLMLPITKGDSCMTSYNTTPKNVLFRFIYAEGSK